MMKKTLEKHEKLIKCKKKFNKKCKIWIKVEKIYARNVKRRLGKWKNKTNKKWRGKIDRIKDGRPTKRAQPMRHQPNTHTQNTKTNQVATKVLFFGTFLI